MWQPHQSTFELCHPLHTTSCGNTPLIHPRQQTLSTAPRIPPTSAWECYFGNCWCHITIHKHTTWGRHRVCITLHETTCQHSTPRCPKPPHNWSITWNHPEEQQSFIHGQAFSPTCRHGHGNQGCPTICQPLHGPSRRNHREAFLWAIPFWKRFIDDIFLIFIGTTEQLQSMKDFMNNLHPTIKFTFEHSTQEISFLEMKIRIGADCKLSTTLYWKPTHCAALLHFHSTHSLKCKKALFSHRLLDITSSLQVTMYYKKNSIF